DGRYEEVYEQDLYDLAYNFNQNKNNAGKFLEKYPQTNILLMNKKYFNENLLNNDWQKAYEDEISIVFIKKDIFKKKYTKPNYDKNYYAKTKYETNINFKKL
ncbi:MAG: hypothetical protein PHV68_10050, partial [Candidatus Gastranaerophilales bacterium]|nr:hypothetical protein [Candidatus Gastranaerophilales bacterium]